MPGILAIDSDCTGTEATVDEGPDGFQRRIPCRGERPSAVRHDWTLDEVLALFRLPVQRPALPAQTVHRAHFDANAVQISTLLSIKTGGCPEDCAYCPQSADYQTGVATDKLMARETVLAEARRAQEAGRDAVLHGGGLALAPGQRCRDKWPSSSRA